jgi:hypothetical protein
MANDNNRYSKQVGDMADPHAWSQQSILNQPQQAMQYAMLAKGFRGMFQDQPSFEPIKNEYMRQYREANGPGLMSNFTGNMNGGDFRRATAMGDQDMLSRLSALHQNFNQHQYDQNQEQSRFMLQQGMKPSFDNIYSTIPYIEAEKLLKRQGVQNIDRNMVEQTAKTLQPNQPLGWNDVRQGTAKAMDFAGNAAGKINQAYNSVGQAYEDARQDYNEGGLRQVGAGLKDKGADLANRGADWWNKTREDLAKQPNKYFPEGANITPEAKAALDNNPDMAAGIKASREGLSPAQNEIAERVTSFLAPRNSPLLKRKDINSREWEQLDQLINTKNPKIHDMLSIMSDPKDIKHLFKHKKDRGDNVNMRWMHWRLERDKKALERVITENNKKLEKEARKKAHKEKK